MYREDIQSILRKQRSFPFLRNVFHQGHGSRNKDQYAKFGYIFSRVGKTKNSESTAMCFQRQKKVYLKICSAKRHAFLLRFIYSQAK